MLSLTENQHYVWQYYLKAWGISTQIWCKRRDKKEPFLTNTRNIGSERFFYEIRELTHDDLAYLEAIISQTNDQRLKEFNRGWIGYFQRTFVLRRSLEGQDIFGVPREELETELRDIEKMLGEAFHSRIESRAGPVIDELRKGSSLFHNNPDQCSDFIFYLCLQYFRTANLRNAMTAIQHPLLHDMNRTWPIEAIIYATNVGASLYRQRLDYRVVFLHNLSEIPFITGDQPVINLRGVEDEALDFYYPLSPRLAMIYTADCERYPSETVKASSVMVESYNFQIFLHSESQIYGNNPEYLKKLSSLPKSI